MDSKTVHHPAGTGSYGLSKFSVKSQSGDKSFRKLGTLLGFGYVTGWWNGAFELDQVHNAIPGSKVKTAHRTRCSKTCTLSIDKATREETLVLAGFQFEVTDGSTHNLKAVAVSPDAKRGEISVTFEGAAAFDFDVVVQYTLVPRSAVIESSARGKRNDGAGRRTRIDYPELKKAHGPSFIRSFSMRFDEGAHGVDHLAIAAVRDSVVVHYTPQGGEAYFANVGLARLRKG